MEKRQDIILENGMEVTIDHNAKDKCKKCGADIIWGVTKNLKLIPLVLVGLAKWNTHFIDCPFVDELRKWREE